MTSPLATNSTPVTSTTLPQRPFSFAASSSSTGLASRRRNNKNLSLCLNDSTARLISAPVTPRVAHMQKGPYAQGPVRIMDNLYLGAEQNALDLAHLRQLSITYMLNVAAEVYHPQEHTFQPFEDTVNNNNNNVLPSPSLSRASTASSVASSLYTITTLPLPSPRMDANKLHPFDAAGRSNNVSYSNKRRQSSVLSINSSTNEQTTMRYKKLPWAHNQDNLVEELDVALAAIDTARESNQTILVHCQCGVARSATVIIAYVMKSLGLGMQEAYDYVKARAPGISPNLGLLYQLREYEQKLLEAHQKQQNLLSIEQQQQAPAPAAAKPPRSSSSSMRPAATPSSVDNSNSNSTSKKSMFRPLSWKRRMVKTTSKVLSLGNTAEQTAEQSDGWWRPRKQSSASKVSVCC